MSLEYNNLVAVVSHLFRILVYQETLTFSVGCSKRGSMIADVFPSPCETAAIARLLWMIAAAVEIMMARSS
jgi:hypothetical protein